MRMKIHILTFIWLFSAFFTFPLARKAQTLFMDDPIWLLGFVPQIILLVTGLIGAYKIFSMALDD